MLSARQKELISFEVIKTLNLKFENFPADASENRNAPFHEAFLKAFAEKLDDKVSDVPYFVSLASWLHGLNTSLGQSFFEKVSHILSNGAKQEFNNLKISPEQQTAVSDIITELKNGVHAPNLDRETRLISQRNSRVEKAIPNFSVDCFYKDDESIVAIELKTVKPNSGIFKSEKEKILLAKAALKDMYPNKDVSYYLGFPFDPLSMTSTSYDKLAFMNYSVEFTKFFEPREILLSSELWDFLSGQSNTMEQLLQIINTIATPQFLEKCEFLNNPNNRDDTAYSSILDEWNLMSERYLFDNEEKVKSLLEKKKKLARAYDQAIFNKKGEYNSGRFTQLRDELQS